MRRALLALALCGCAAELGEERRRSDVIGGTEVAAGDFAAVVALIDVNGVFYCSGTLVTPSAVLTAAHCLEGTSVPGISLAADVTAIDLAEVLPGLAKHQHPSFDYFATPDLGLDQLFDIGVLELAEPIPGVEPEVVATPAEAAELLVASAIVHMVGYGVSDEETGASGIKLEGDATLRELNATEFLVSEVGEPQNCRGDSGGPGFIADARGARRLVGVVSRGPDPDEVSCTLGGVDTRADAYLAWIEEVLAGVDAGPGAPVDAAVVAGAPDAGSGEPEAGGCCAIAGRRRPPARGGWLPVALIGVVALARMRRRVRGCGG
jgi:secreted trypsin-like serine protease